MIEDLRRWLRRRWHATHSALWYTFRWLPPRLGRAKVWRGEYDFCMAISDAFLGLRYRGRRGTFGILGVSLDYTWYEGGVSLGLVVANRFFGFFVDPDPRSA